MKLTGNLLNKVKGQIQLAQYRMASNLHPKQREFYEQVNLIWANHWYPQVIPGMALCSSMSDGTESILT